ncbi:Uncharacterized protein C3orf19-like [Papilio machaon]|uniref:Uncharacterized protein C3orf19-like n=1 Tax=Papilio machaon TaxID=76193 RepID=A0A194QZB8_PAPMA|nr:Uncharacterized protein C3orf19-like [Papilio machaon]
MNEQSVKKISFNKSILLGLKAELLKKQEEVIEKKQLPQHKVENFKPPKAEKKPDDNQQSHKTFKDNLKAVDTDELEAIRKSKLALEKKAELYEHLSDKRGNSQLAERFLVDFNGKKVAESKETEQHSDVETETVNNVVEDESEWIEFTDCLGRSRKCHKSEVELFKKRDKELMRVITNSDDNEPVEETKQPEKPFLVQKTNDYLQSLREKWDEKEKELLAKDKDIHYQDLLFDEARIHGVGYYSFSTDETTRQKQMQELLKQRQETLRAQKEAEEKKKKRDELLEARVAAARARQRARAGLPPEEPKKNEKDFTTCLLEFLTQQRNEAENKAKEEEKKIREEQEKDRQKLRETYVREWDIGKEGMDEKVKKFRELTQEEYVEQQRSKRIDEFAPLPQTSTTASQVFDDKGNIVQGNKSWSDVRPKTPPPPIIGPIDEVPKGLFFTTKKDLKYKNFVPASTPIINELDDDEDRRPEKRRNVESTEIAPPPTYDYYGPIPKQAKGKKPFDSDINEAYTQGARSLETKKIDRKLPQHYDFTFD